MSATSCISAHFLRRWRSVTSEPPWRCAAGLGVSPSLLLHPLDFLGKDDNVGLKFFPAMNLASDYKLRLVGELLGSIARLFKS